MGYAPSAYSSEALLTLRQPQLAGRRDIVSESGVPTPQYKGSDTTSLRHSKQAHLFLASHSKEGDLVRHLN